MSPTFLRQVTQRFFFFLASLSPSLSSSWLLGPAQSALSSESDFWKQRKFYVSFNNLMSQLLITTKNKFRFIISSGMTFDTLFRWFEVDPFDNRFTSFFIVGCFWSLVDTRFFLDSSSALFWSSLGRFDDMLVYTKDFVDGYENKQGKVLMCHACRNFGQRSLRLE